MTLFSADVGARTLTGLVLPFDELSSPSVDGTEPILFTEGTVELPADPSVVTLYDRDHDRHSPRGRATALEATERGIVATFAVARTPEGDALLERATDTEQPKLRLSAELGQLARSGARALFAVLTGASIATVGAFASAALFSVAPDAEPTETTPDPEGEAQAPAGPGGQTPAEEDADADITETETTMPEAIATIPEGVVTPSTEKPDKSAGGLFAAVAARDGAALTALETQDNASALFAISPIQHSGPAAVTIGADVQETGYLGELWSRQPYDRKYVPLFNQRPLTSYRVSGWRWITEPTVAAYAGNTAEIASNTIDTEPVTADARRIAGGHRIDRRYLDFNDQTVVESYFRLMAESYARVSDADVLASAVTAAGAAVAIVPKAGVDKGIVGIIQGALKVIASGNTPSFAVVDPAVYENVLYTIKNTGLEFLDQAFGLEKGAMSGFQIIPGAVGANRVLVGAKQAIDVFELPGSPIRVEGIAPHHGAIDPALYGYLAHIVNNAAALALMNVA